MNGKTPDVLFMLAVGVVCVVLSGGSAAQSAKVDTNAVGAFVAAQLAYAKPESEPEPEPPGCTCNGTGRSGDGYGPCVCGDDCQCKKSGEPAKDWKSPVVLEIWTAKWCGPCQVDKATIIPWLKKSGWEEGVNYVFKDYDTNTDEAKANNVVSLPTYIMRENGAEVRRHVGSATTAVVKTLIGTLTEKYTAVSQQPMDGNVFAGAMPSRSVFDKVQTLLRDKRLEIGDGIALTSDGKVNATVVGSPEQIDVEFGKPYLMTDINKFFFTIRKPITKVRLANGKAYIYLDGAKTPTTEYKLP